VADEPAGTEPPSGGGGPAADPDSPKADRKKQVKNERILIIVGILGLILTYVFIKRSSANSAASTSPATSTATSPYGYASSPASGGEGYAGSYDDGQIGTDLAAIQAELAGLVPPVTTPPSGATPAPATVTSQTNSGLTPITTDVANTVQAGIAGGNIYYNSGLPGSSPQQVSQPTPGGPWMAGSAPLQGNPTGAPGSPSEFFSYTPPVAA